MCRTGINSSSKPGVTAAPAAMGSLFSCSLPSSPVPQGDLEAYLEATSARRLAQRRPSSLALLTMAPRTLPRPAVGPVLVKHPWTRLLGPSQLVEMHEVFSKFGASPCELHRRSLVVTAIFLALCRPRRQRPHRGQGAVERHATPRAQG